MEAAVAVAVVGASGGAGGGGKDGGGEQQPSARRDVREWQRVDAATGAVERARIQSDRWATRTATGQQRCYGKVVASSVRDAADGRPEAQSLRQVEVFRQRGPQGSFQVVRASSSTSTSTSTSSASPSAAAATAAAARLQLAFDNLQLPLHRLDVGPQRTRASVARSGSLSARRPPTRQLRAIAAAPADGDANDEGPSQPAASEEDSQVDSLTAQVSRICGQLHVEARRAALGERDGAVRIEDSSPQAPHALVARRRSNSIEDLQADDGGGGGGRLEESKIWDRASHVRRSLQFPSKPPDREPSPRPQSLAVGRFFSEDSKLCEGGKLKGLEAFENILRRGANIADSVNKSLTHDRDDLDASSADSLAKHLRSGSIMDVYMRRNSAKGSSASSASKRHSFVTVESLKEVRERLRPLNSPSDEEPKTQKNIFKFPKDDEENDDGIVSDDHVKHPDSESGSEMAPSKVKSYILGMEILANNKNGTRKPILGTGSLESRTSSRTSSSGTHRSEEWYNRRKSYGFEQVHAADVDNSRSNRLWEKNKVESSTDSGICRSSEAVSGLPWNRTSPTKIEEGKSLDFRKSENLLNMGHSIQIKQDSKEKILEDNEKEEESPLQQRRKTVVTLRNEGNKSNSNFKSREDGSIVVHNSIIKDSSMSMNDYRTPVDEEPRLKSIVGLRGVRDFQRQSKPVTITIPIVSGEVEKENNEMESQPNLFRLSAETSSLSERSDLKSAFTNGAALKDSFKRGTWNGGDDWKKSIDNEMKRHSIAVDESKYVREGIKRFSNLHDSANKELANVSTSELVKRFAAMNNGKKDDGIFSNNEKFNYNSNTSGFNVSFVQNGDGLMTDDQNKRHKKVEFCKTEVHFAAESGRVNIVETDEKPPPSNPIRRRRRNSAAASIGDAGGAKSNLPEIRFGDSPYEKQLLGGNETTDVTETPSAPMLVKPEPTRPTVLALGAFQKDLETDDHVYAQVKPVFSSSNSKESTLSSSCEETTSEHVNVTGLTNEQMPRSILKNNRKPKPFILSSSNDSTLESSDNQEDKWAVRLKPLHVNTDNSPTAMWRSTVTLRSTAFDGLQSSPTERKEETLSSINAENHTENELQRMLRQLRPAGQRKSTSDTDFSLNVHSSPVTPKKSISEPSNNSVQVTVTSPETEPLFSGWSVADRVKQVEEMKQSSVETKGYSTRVNFGSGEATVVESGSSDDQQNLSLKPTGGPSLFQKSDKCKPMWLRREEKKQELQGSEPAVAEAPHSQVVTMSAMLPSYDPNRLRRVETLVSTRSGQPKITSIALRYEGDEPDDRLRAKNSSSTTTNNPSLNSAWKNLEPAPSHSHLPPRRDEKVAIGFTYYKPKEIPKEQTPPQDDRRDKTFKIEKHANQLQIEEVLREKDSRYRGSLFSSERRSNSSADYHQRSSSPAKRPSGFLSPTMPTERERERYLSPSPKPLSKPTTYFGEHSPLSNSTFSNTYQKEFHRKTNENSRSYERKSEENIHSRSSANSSVSSVHKSVGESNHKRSSPEKTKKGDERVPSDGRRRSFDSPSRSQGPSRGRSLSPTKRLEPKKVQPPPEPEVDDYDSPIYENIDDLLEEEPPSVRRAETDSAILEELTRAADQILQAVNGYTDEDSRASSDDDDLDRRHRRGRRGGRPAERMTTIDEAPAARRASASASSSGGVAAAAAATSRRSQQQQQRLARQCTRLAAHNSSTSSIESVTRESPQRQRGGAAATAATGGAPGAGARALLTRERMVVEETRRKVCSASAPSTAAAAAASRGRSRAARLLQRASSRELLLDARASSSEDATSGAEAMPVRKMRCARRVRASSSSAAKSSSQAASASSSTRRTSPAVAAPQQPSVAAAAASTTAAAAAGTGAARTKRRESHDPKARSHAARAEDGRRRVSGRREESDVTRTRGSRPSGLHHQHPISSAVITSSSCSSRRAASGLQQQQQQRRSTSTATSSSRTATTTTAAAAPATANGPSHAVAKKPSSSRSESLAHSNKISK